MVPSAHPKEGGAGGDPGSQPWEPPARREVFEMFGQILCSGEPKSIQAWRRGGFWLALALEHHPARGG